MCVLLKPLVTTEAGEGAREASRQAVCVLKMDGLQNYMSRRRLSRDGGCGGNNNTDHDYICGYERNADYL